MATDELVQRAQRGDQEAIEELFRLEWPTVYRQLYRAVPDPLEAQDLAQEVFIRAFKGLDRYQSTGAPFRAYLHAIARNLLRERWRRQGARLVALEQAGDLAAPLVLEEQVLDALTHADLLRALAALPPDYQTVIRLRILEGRSTAEVAALMHRTPGAVRVLQYRALAMLRGLLHEGTLP